MWIGFITPLQVGFANPMDGVVKEHIQCNVSENDCLAISSKEPHNNKHCLIRSLKLRF